mmetsp:Transcript_52520/g.164944  ORF Transcript_52520/g.164944 Transcript_52520/m.164944 type:complete len:224 (-) Transcript_52520:7-678(-)
MLSFIFPAAASTDKMRTWTSCPTSSSSSMLSTNPSLICARWTRPSAAVPSSAVRPTKAPKGAMRNTLPVSHWSGLIPVKADRSGGASVSSSSLPAPEPRIVRLSLFRSKSTDSTRTRTCWPISNSSSTLSTKPRLTREMCTRPSPCAAPSGSLAVTNTPNGTMPETVPSSHSSGEMFPKASRSEGGACSPPPSPIRLSTMLSPSLPSLRTALTQTSTSWPSSR